MKKYLPALFFIILAAVFAWKFFIFGLIPVPADSLVGLYHPYRDFYAEEYPNGIPFKNFLITDPVRQQYPWRLLAVEDVKNGLYPSWNPYSFSGTPLIGNYQSSPYYPLNILFTIFPFDTAWSLLVILQPFLAGLFMYLFISLFCKTKEARIIGASTFAFSSVVVSWLTWNTLVHVVLWLPLILFAFEKVILDKKNISLKSLVLYSFVLYVSLISLFLAGHAQVAFYSVIMIAAYFIFRFIEIRKISRRSMYAIIIVFSLSLFTVFRQLTELVNFINLSNRSIDTGTINQEGWFIPIVHLFQFVAPDFFGNPATLNYWGTWNYGELTGYVGIIGFVFALFGLIFSKSRMKSFFSTFLLLSILLAIKNPISELPFILGIPLFSTSQPTRLLFVVIFSLAILTSLGVEEFITNTKSRIHMFYVIGVLFLILGVVWVCILGNLNLLNLSDFIENIQVAKRNLYLPTALLLISSVIIVVMIFSSKKQKYISGLFALLIIIMIFDLFRFGWKFTPFVNAEYLYPTTKSIEFLTKQPGQFRVMSTDDRLLASNITISHKLQTIDGYDPLYLKNYGEFASSIVRNRPDISPFSFNRIIAIHNVDNRLVDFLNVKYVLSLDDISDQKLVKVFEEGHTKIYENKNAYPRAFLVNSYRKANNAQEAINLLYDQNLDLHQTAVIFEDVEISSSPIVVGEQVTIESYANSSIELRTQTRETRLLVLSDVYYPKWKAFIDDREVRIYEVNYAFRGIIIPPGEHAVLFKYL